MICPPPSAASSCQRSPKHLRLEPPHLRAAAARRRAAGRPSGTCARETSRRPTPTRSRPAAAAARGATRARRPDRARPTSMSCGPAIGSSGPSSEISMSIASSSSGGHRRKARIAAAGGDRACAERPWPSGSVGSMWPMQPRRSPRLCSVTNAPPGARELRIADCGLRDCGSRDWPTCAAIASRAICSSSARSASLVIADHPALNVPSAAAR